MTPDLWADAWRAYLLQYVGLGAIFFFGLWIAIRAGELSWKNPAQRRWLLIMLGGFVFFAGIHAFFQFVGPTL